MVSQQEFPGGPLRFGLPMEDVHSDDDASVSGDGSNSGASLHESVSATGGIEVQKAAETQTAVSGHNTAVVPEHIDKQLESKDSALENAVAQGSVPSFQGAGQIKPARMDNSAGNGFAYYDPYRSAELAQSMRDQASGPAQDNLSWKWNPMNSGRSASK